MSESLQVAIENSIATITLNRPDKMNALDIGSWERLGQIMDELSANDDLRCVVLRGAGVRAFSAGADIDEFPTHRRDARQAEQYGRVNQRTINRKSDV